ncbi:Cell division protein DivIB [Lactococcus lactis]|nr:Cell division protein DivIB [Lactococcus lactis]
MTELLAKSQLFLGRSGSTTIAEVTALGLPAVYVPSPNVTADQQTKNAQEYVDQGAAIIIKDEDLTGQTLVEAISNILENNEKYQEMQAASLKAGVPDASQRLYNLVKENYNHNECKDNNLTPWQQKHLEYQKRKAEEAKKEKKANQPKKVHFSSPFLKSLPKTEKNFDDTRDEAESAELLEEGFETNNEETQSSEAPIENEKIIAQLEQLSQENEYEYEEEQIKRPSRFSSLFKGSAPLLKKMWPALAIVVLVFVGSLYLISPLSKISTFSVSGNANESSEQVALASGIQTSDSIFNILNNKEKIETTIEQKFPRISAVTINYHFPNRFEAIVKEHTNSVYVKRNNQTYLVLNNGYVISLTQLMQLSLRNCQFYKILMMKKLKLL